MTKFKSPVLRDCHAFITAEARQLKARADMCGRKDWAGNEDAKLDYEHLMDLARGLVLIDIDLQIKGEKHAPKSR